MKAIWLLLAGLTLSGCTASKHKLDSGNPYWIDYDLTRRGALVSYDGEKLRYCAEPSPDAVRSRSFDTLAKVKNGTSTDINAELKYQTAILDLTKRTETLNVLRDALSNLCFASMNNGMTSQQYLVAFNKFLAVIENMSGNDKVKSAVDITSNLEKTTLSNEVQMKILSITE